MKLKHRIGLTIIDKLLLAGALFLVTLDVTAGLTAIGWDALSSSFGLREKVLVSLRVSFPPC
jgi:hypothetical protein